jgi:hypothetical protein
MDKLLQMRLYCHVMDLSLHMTNQLLFHKVQQDVLCGVHNSANV